MEDNRWLRLMTIGLVLAALAVGYFLLSGRLTSNNATKAQVYRVSQTPTPTTVPTATSSPKVENAPTPTATPTSAYGSIVNRTKGEVQTLPRTGFPVGLVAALSLSAIISGLGLRKFPR